MKISFVSKDAKQVLRWFGVLSLGTLIFALCSVVYHGLTKPTIIPDSDLILILFGLVNFVLGIVLANSYEIQDLKRRMNL